jgi:transposase InsO family protein
MAPEGLPVNIACRVLNVSHSGYYDWRSRSPSLRMVRQVWLTDLIIQVHAESFGVYGAPRVHAELTLGRGIVVGHRTIALLMRRAGIKGLPNHRRPRPRHDTPTAVDLVDRNFARPPGAESAVGHRHHRAPHQGGQGVLRGRPGRALPTRRGLVDRLQPDRRPRDERAGHGDREPHPTTAGNGDPFRSRGFTSWAFTRRAHDFGLVPSMGSIGDCFDNPVIESFWGRVQTELLNRRRWKTRIELANALFEYLEIFHNRQRRHSALGMLTPTEYEILHSIDPVA